MRFFYPLALAAILFSFDVSGSAQETPQLRIGIAVMRSGVNTIPLTEARDKLANALNRKSDKKLSIEAVALDEPLGHEAMAEARDKNCQFVLSTTLTNLATTYEVTSLTGVGLPIFHAVLGYQVNRVVDGTEFAVGSISAQDSISFRDAVWHALTQIAGKAITEISRQREMPNDASANATPGTVGSGAPGKLMNPVSAHDYCAWLPSDMAHTDALRGVCQYAIPLLQRMPNFVCEQSTTRYRGDSRAPFDMISASLRYEDGHESYSNLKVNGRAVSGGVDQTPGLRSTGEFTSNLRAVFNQTNRARFQYAGEGKQGDHAVWIFSYQIAEQKEPVWVLQGPNQVLAPPYSGELWIDQKSGAVVRFRSLAKDMPPTFPMRNVDLQIDYENVAFGDGTDFILPVDSWLSNVYAGQTSSRNVMQFRNCHMFKATAHIVLTASTPTPAAISPSASPSSVEALLNLSFLEKDLAENEAIFAAIADRELRDSELRSDAEQRQMLDVRTAAALQKWPPPRQQPGPPQPEELAEGFPEAATGSLSTLKIKVNLVLVSVVARNSSGHAVGNLSQSDFHLTDDRIPQPIRSFTVEKSGGQGPAVAPTGSQIAPVETQSQIPATERDVAYIFDDLHGAADLANAKSAALRHLARLQPADRAAVVSTSGQVHADFTDDHDQLARAIQNLKPYPTQSSADCPSLSHYMADLMVNQRDQDANDLAVADTMVCTQLGGNSPGSRLPDILTAEAQRIATRKAMEVLSLSHRDVEQALHVLRDVIRGTALLPGKRSIVLVSPGFLTVAPDMQQAVTELIHQAIRSDIVINALDIRGLASPSLGASRQSTANPSLRARFDRAESSLLNGVMADLTYGTGGILFQNNNDLDEGFRRTAEAPEYVYVLGFSPQKLDGKFHKLKVTLTGPEKVTVQARKGYYALKPETATPKVTPAN